MSEVIQTQVMGFAEYWIVFIFFICLSLVFLLINSKRGKTEIMILHLLIMCISLLIAGLSMLSYDVLFTLCFILFQVISWLMNLMMVKI
jgi:hypothetical protein